MNHYVLSARKELGCPIGLAEDYGLFDKFYKDVKTAQKDIGSFPWYADSWDCELPKNACYITKSKRIDFGARSLSGSLYMISEEFLDLIKSHKSKHYLSGKIEVKNKLGEDVASSDYYIARILQVPFAEVIDASKSRYIEDDTRVQLEILVCKSEFKESLFGIGGLIGEHSTLFCSKSFRDAAVQSGIKGIDFFEQTKARWQTMTSFLMNAGKKEPANTVWPI